VSPHEHTPRNPRPADAPSAPSLSITQIEAKVAAELSNLLNVVAACGERVATSPDVTAAARLDLLALAGRSRTRSSTGVDAACRCGAGSP
jgi:hypothetical protein